MWYFLKNKGLLNLQILGELRCLFYNNYICLLFKCFEINKKIYYSFSNTFCPGQKLETSCGSLAYSAPEILIGNSYNATAVGENNALFLLPTRNILYFFKTYSLMTISEVKLN